MTGSTKILTVSYGTFSCTLEGFDDPFGTMRGIAEYFRDLAADDRYFGAEPPTPDVEMLQRIAEKEVQRRVEARLGDGGVSLTQLTSAKPAAPVAEKKATVETPAEVPQAVRTAAPAPKADDDDLDHGPLAHDDEYLLSDEPEDVLAVDPDARPSAEGPAESVAEKLRRIRAVVSRSIEPEAGDDTRSFSHAQAPDAGENETLPKRDRALTETIRQITEDLSDDEDAAQDSQDSEEDEDNLFDEQDASAQADDALADTEIEDEDATPEAVAVAPTASDEDDDGWDIDLDMSRDEIVATAEVDEDDDDGWAIDLDVPAKTEVEDLQDDEPADIDSSDDMLSRVLARKDAPATEILRLERDDAVQTPRTERRVSRPLTPISESNGDVGRLLAETDNHLNDDESVRRRRVISQMRAAVAATKADRLVSRRVTSREAEDAAEQERYRDDLNEVVRDVTRPLPGKASDRRPSVAPLVLVSSQRVDAADRAPDRSETARPAAEVEDFAGFAKSMGARELSDLLEAAAAYTSFVEGQSSFSRPEIMKRVARVDPALKLSREDGLRSFGQLLRQGKFRKLERGQFTISENTRFKPQHRIAGE